MCSMWFQHVKGPILYKKIYIKGPFSPFQVALVHWKTQRHQKNKEILSHHEEDGPISELLSDSTDWTERTRWKRHTAGSAVSHKWQNRHLSVCAALLWWYQLKVPGAERWCFPFVTTQQPVSELSAARRNTNHFYQQHHFIWFTYYLYAFFV